MEENSLCLLKENCMQNNNVHLPHQNPLQGLLILIAGFLLLLYTLNLVTAGVNLVLIIVAMCLIMYGAIASGLYQMLKNLLHSMSDMGKKKH